MGFRDQFGADLPFRDRFDSDLRFYYAVGAFVIAVYVVAIAVVSVVAPGGIDGRTLLPLSIGFFAFMFVYFISISIQRLVTIEDV